MIPFDTFTLAAVAAELRATVLGARVQKVQQPSASDLVISLYGKGGARRLLLSADPQGFRAHLTQVRRENPVMPPAFCAVCRKYLEGARLDEIAMPRFDRVLRLTFHAHDGERLTLIAELVGRNANLVLVSGAGIVRGSIRPSPSTERPLRAGGPYADPPGYQDRRDPLALDAPAIRALCDASPARTDPDARTAKTWLMATFSGIGGFGVDEVLARAEAAGGAAEALAALMDDVRAERFAPHATMGTDGATEGVWAFPPLSVPPGRRFPRESVSVALDTFYAVRAEQAAEASERGLLAKAIARETAYREKELASARTTLAEAGRAAEYERAGHLLLTNLHLVPKGAGTVRVPDLYAGSGAEREITLDPKRTPQENAQSYFDRARKSRDAADYAEGRAEDLEAELATLAALAAELERAEGDEAYSRVRRALTDLAGAKRVGVVEPAGARPPARAKEKPYGGHRVRTFTVGDYELLVGETAEANDYVTTRVAAPTDLWLHVRAGTGAHGVLRTQGRPSAVPETAIRRAAEIVAARSGSSVKHAGLVAVDVVEKKYVRKPRGARPGLVTYSRERSLDVSPSL